MKKKKVIFIQILCYLLDQGNGKKCVSVENTSTIIVDGKPDPKVFNFDFVGHETIE